MKKAHTSALPDQIKEIKVEGNHLDDDGLNTIEVRGEKSKRTGGQTKYNRSDSEGFEDQSIRVNDVGARKIEGTNFNQNGVCEINNDQAELEQKMHELE